MRLIFVRHGEPDYAHDCLTENGVVQAKCTAGRLRDEKIKAVYSSPMGRAVETASYTAKDHGLEVKTLDFMHEIDWGDDGHKIKYGGHPWTLACELLTENPEFVGSAEWNRHPFFRDNKCMKFYDRISQEFDGFLSGYGLERKAGLYCCREYTDDTIALFAHGGSGAVMFSHVLNLPFPFVLSSLPYGVCSVSIIEFRPQDADESFSSGGSDGAGENQRNRMVIPRLELFNDMGHIENIKHERLHFDK